VIQRDVLVCQQSDRRRDSLQTYTTAVGRCFMWCIRTPNAFVRRHSTFDSTSNRATLRVSDFTLKYIGVFVIYLNMVERSSQLTVLVESYWRTKWWEPFILPCVALATSRSQVS